MFRISHFGFLIFLSINMNNRVHYQERLFTNYQSGIAALMVVVVIGAAVLLMAVTATMLGLGELEMGSVAADSGSVSSAADGCMEELFRRIKLDNSYGLGAGNIELIIDDITCQMTVTDLGLNNRELQVVASRNDIYRSLSAEVHIVNNRVEMTSWQMY